MSGKSRHTNRGRRKKAVKRAHAAMRATTTRDRLDALGKLQDAPGLIQATLPAKQEPEAVVEAPREDPFPGSHPAS